VSAPRLKFPEQPLREPVPLEGFADRVRDAMGLRAQELEALNPEALDLAAQVVAALHDGLHGEATAHRGNRGANYFRQQLRGEHPISIEDLSRLALEAPVAVLGALTVLARELRYDLQPVAPTPSNNLHQELATFSRSAGSTAGGLADALADGRTTPEEARRELERLRAHKHDVARIEASLEAVLRTGE